MVQSPAVPQVSPLLHTAPVQQGLPTDPQAPEVQPPETHVSPLLHVVPMQQGCPAVPHPVEAIWQVPSMQLVGARQVPPVQQG